MQFVETQASSETAVSEAFNPAVAGISLPNKLFSVLMKSIKKDQLVHSNVCFEQVYK